MGLIGTFLRCTDQTESSDVILHTPPPDILSESVRLSSLKDVLQIDLDGFLSLLKGEDSSVPLLSPMIAGIYDHFSFNYQC